VAGIDPVDPAAQLEAEAVAQIDRHLFRYVISRQRQNIEPNRRVLASWTEKQIADRRRALELCQVALRDGRRDIADRLLASLGSMLCYWHHYSRDGRRIDLQTDDDSIGAHFLHLLHGRKPSAAWVRAMHTSLNLYAEHEFNASTFAAEASVSRFDMQGCCRYSLILRNVQDQLAAENRLRELEQETAYLLSEIAENQNGGEIVGNSQPIRAVVGAVCQVAPTPATVLITGETGTGKELVARAIHQLSERAARPFVRVNCAAIPAALCESEFFGHERGAFTGAATRRTGRFELAHRGTIFLDEVGELPLELQPKLLRILQDGEYEPVGSSQTRKVDVRVIAATNRDLSADVKAGKFREDLFYRLHVFPIAVPPLRERGSDVEILARRFIDRYCARSGKAPLELTADCLRRLRSYQWPGNVRELENVIERAVIITRDARLSLREILPVHSLHPTRERTHAATGPVLHTKGELRRLERETLVRALEQAHWKVAGAGGAAQKLGIPPSTLSSRMKALRIERPKSDLSPTSQPARPRKIVSSEKS